MKGLELFDLLKGGARPLITATSKFEDFESCIDDGMIGRIVGCGHTNDDVFWIDVDLNDWDAYNDTKAKSNYWDNGEHGEKQARLTAKEAGFYPKNGIERVYLGYDDDYTGYFAIGPTQRIVPLTITGALVRIGTVNDVDLVHIDTTLPSTIEGDSQPARMTVPCQAGTGVEWVKEHFGFEPEVQTKG